MPFEKGLHYICKKFEQGQPAIVRFSQRPITTFRMVQAAVTQNIFYSPLCEDLLGLVHHNTRYIKPPFAK